LKGDVFDIEKKYIDGMPHGDKTHKQNKTHQNKHMAHMLPSSELKQKSKLLIIS
jgi:hypothetical protein